MVNKVYLAVTGYYGTGSSAVIDLLKEYCSSGIAAPVKTEYEHVPFYYPGGLFDLYTALSSPHCSVYNSDIVINNFILSTKRLNNYDYGWIGSYKKHYGNAYMEMANKLIRDISRKTGRQSAAHMYKVRFSLLKAVLQIGARILIKRPITKLGRHYVTDNNPGYYAMPSKDLLGKACKEFVTSYLCMCESGVRINIFDHLLWPQQCGLINELFPNNFKVIVVKRDPRDVYLLNKYYWFKPPVDISKPYYPTDVETFCKEWKETIRTEFSSPNVLCVDFEDLVYKYDETVKEIEAFIGIDSCEHVNAFMSFMPEKSIENTQIFRFKKEWGDEVQLIERTLSEYLYEFPYERTPDKNGWFDNEAQLSKIKKK